MRLIILAMLACFSLTLCGGQTGQRAANPLFNPLSIHEPAQKGTPVPTTLTRKSYGALPHEDWGTAFKENEDPLAQTNRYGAIAAARAYERAQASPERLRELQQLRLREMSSTPPGKWKRLMAWCKRKFARSRPGTPETYHGRLVIGM